MSALTPEQCLQIVQIDFDNRGCIGDTYSVLRPFYSRNNRLSEQVIRVTVNRFRTTHTLVNPHPQRCTVRTEDVVVAVG